MFRCDLCHDQELSKSLSRCKPTQRIGVFIWLQRACRRFNKVWWFVTRIKGKKTMARTRVCQSNPADVSIAVSAADAASKVHIRINMLRQETMTGFHVLQSFLSFSCSVRIQSYFLADWFFTCSSGLQTRQRCCCRHNTRLAD